MRVITALLVLVAACDEPPARSPVPPPAPTTTRSVADPARGAESVLDGATPAFATGVLAELSGDDAAAREAFERVLADSDVPTALQARSALHLAQLESRAGRSRHALDLVVRASSLAPGDTAIFDGIAQLRADAAAASGDENFRGPPIGTTLPGVDPAVAKKFAAAERKLAAVHELRTRPYIEALSSTLASIRSKEAATESAVRAYRAVADAGGLALVAGHYRAGTLFHDLALGLLFDLPPELDPTVAAGLRRTFRARALAYLKKAVTEYEAALSGSPLPDDTQWRLATEADLRAARDLLGEGA